MSYMCAPGAADTPSGSSAGQSVPAAAPVAAAAQPSTSTQWEGPDLTQDTTTVVVCTADGTRQVRRQAVPTSYSPCCMPADCIPLCACFLSQQRRPHAEHQGGCPMWYR